MYLSKLWFRDLGCKTCAISCTETILLDCTALKGSHNCSHRTDIDVWCKPCTEGDIRLQGGIAYGQGSVEICNNGAWFNVCDRSWDYNDAQVACRQLGLPFGGKSLDLELEKILFLIFVLVWHISFL